MVDLKKSRYLLKKCIEKCKINTYRNSARITDGSEDTNTLRHLTKKPKRSTYLSNKKKVQITKPTVGVATVEKTQPVRPSDII